MRKLIVAAMLSLDGVIQASGGPEEDPAENFAYGGWAWPFASDDEAMDGQFTRPFALVLGRRTYDIFADYWPQVPSDAPHGDIADAFNAASKYAATHHPASLAWHNSHALGSDVIGALRELKRGDGADLVTQGSSDLVHQLLASDVVDEVLLLSYPLLLGAGKRLFDDAAQASSFRLAASRVTSSGVVVSRYLRDGGVRIGSFPSD